MAASYKYSIEAVVEPVIKDLPAQPDTYQEGEVLKAGIAEEGGVASMGIGDYTSGGFIGVSNQGETLPAQSGLHSAGNPIANNGATLAGTQALGTLDTLQVIINPSAVYAVEYSQDTEQTYVANVDTQIDIADGVATTGHPGFGGGWLWSDLGELDYVVSSALNAGNTEYTVVTGNNTASATGIILYPSGSGLSYPIELTADALFIAAGEADIGVAGTNAVTGYVLENRLASKTHGNEILRPKQTPGPGGVQNQSVRTRGSGSADLTRAFAYVKFDSVLGA
jgi:hypothetical protein